MTHSASHRKLTRAAIAACAIWGFTSQSPTWADTTWTGGGSTSEFGDAGNWDAVAPDGSDLAIFGNVGSTPQLPTFNAVAPGDSVLGLRIDNAGIDWSMVKNIVTANDRGLTIGASGIVVQGGGTAAVAPNALRLGADQDWDISANTTLTLDGGGTIKSPISGAFKITKKGAGTLQLVTNSGGAFAPAWTGGLDIVAGTVHNTFSTNGAGTGPVSVRNGATYLTSANNAGAIVTFFDGSTLKGSGTSGGITGSNAIAVDSAATNVYVTTTGTTGDVLGINANNPFTGGNTNTVINFSA